MAAAREAAMAAMEGASGSPKAASPPSPGNRGKTLQKKTKSAPSFMAKPPPKKEKPNAWDFLDTERSWKATQGHGSPHYTIREKFPPPDRFEQRPGAYNYGGNLTRNGPASSPSWTMNARATGIPTPPPAPGPGHYGNRSTLYRDHPAIINLPGVGMPKEKRHDPHEHHSEMAQFPSPLDYQTKVAENYQQDPPAHTRAPAFTIREKPPQKSPEKPHKKDGKQPEACFYDVQGWHSRMGTVESPKWTMLKRATGIPSPPQAPGPGTYASPGTIYGSHPTLTSAPRAAHANSTRTEDKPLYPSRGY